MWLRPAETVHTEGGPSFHHACEVGPLCKPHHGFGKQVSHIRMVFELYHILTKIIILVLLGYKFVSFYQMAIE